MTTDRQIAANRQNAQHSTGPRTAQGKASASRNNTRHGLRSSTPVIPRLESPEAWEQHRTATITSLAPASAIEEALAERVALILWRLDRVARYERDVTSQSRDRAPADLAGGTASGVQFDADSTDRDLVAVRQRYNEARRRARVLASLDDRPPDAHITGKDAASALDTIDDQLPDFDTNTFCAPDIVPNHLEYDVIPDWTVDRLLRFVAAVAGANNRDPEELRADTLAEARRRHNAERITCRRLTRQVQELRRQRILPQDTNLAQVVRYENHLMRQLSQTLTHLRQIQQQRRADRLRPPDTDYHHPYDFYDDHIYGTPSPDPVAPDPIAAPVDLLFVSPYDRSDDEPPSHLPLSAPVGAQCLAPTGGEGCRSNPIEAPGPPGQPQTVDGAAPECAIPAPECSTCAPDCTLSEHPSAHQDTVSPPDRS